MARRQKRERLTLLLKTSKRNGLSQSPRADFCLLERNAPIKTALKDGLNQLNGWDKFITPQPAKSFAIGTFLRESADTSGETSFIAFVDPEPEAPENPVEFPPDAVRRANYASWLSAMGLEDASK